jgi:hypothetical protein
MYNPLDMTTPRPDDYADFDLEITRLPGGRSRAHVLRWPVGKGEAHFDPG